MKQNPASNPEYEEPTPQALPSYGSDEEEVKNIVGQIDPQRILDNLNHSLKGEYYNKEKGAWEKVGGELANDECRGWVISYFTHILNNASTMGFITKQQFSNLMEEVIDAVTREFKCNLEKFGFVPPSKRYKHGEYENKGPVDSSRMNSISGMIYKNAFLIYSRSVEGAESKRIFRSLTMADPLTFRPQENKRGILGNIFGR